MSNENYSPCVESREKVYGTELLSDIVKVRMQKLFEKGFIDDRVVAFEPDSNNTNGLMLTLARYAGCDFDLNSTYKLFVAVCPDKVKLYDYFLDDYRYGVREQEGGENWLAEYDEIMRLTEDEKQTLKDALV